jgi:hypothetical protein
MCSTQTKTLFQLLKIKEKQAANKKEVAKPHTCNPWLKNKNKKPGALLLRVVLFELNFQLTATN